MPTKRRRIAHGSTLPREVWNVFAIGMAINSHSDEWLRENWRTWGAEVCARYRREFGDEGRPFGQILADAEGWNAD